MEEIIGPSPENQLTKLLNDFAKNLAVLIPVITACTYITFAYFVKLENGSSQTSFKVFNGKKAKVITIQKDNLKVFSQTSSERVIGTYMLPKGKIRLMLKFRT